LGGGTLTLAGALTVSSSGNPLGAVISGPGNLSVGTATRTITVGNSASVPASQAELTISAPIISVGLFGITKSGLGNLLLSGANVYSGTSTFNSGTTFLDYSSQNNSKLGTGALAMLGGSLVLNGNSSANTVQTVASTTFAGGGFGTITLNSGVTEQIVLNLGALTRAAGGGTVRFNLPEGTQSATHGITTATTNNAITGLLGSGAGFATVTTEAGTFFATNFTNSAGGNIVAAATTANDDVSTWAAGVNLTDSTGYTGIVNGSSNINSLRFNASGPSTVSIGTGETLTIVSGGILQTEAVTGGLSSINGGRLSSGTGNELIFTVDSTLQRLDIGSSVSGADLITKTGEGILRLTGNNTSNGAVRILAGTLELTGGSALGDTAPVTFLAVGGSPATLSLLAGQTETIGSIVTGGGVTSTTSTVLVGAGSTLTVNQTAAGTYAGLLSGTTTSTLIKSGAAALTLQGNSTGYAGVIHVNQGTLLLSGNFNQLSALTGLAINGPSSIFQISNDQTTATNSKIPDTTPITLNNTAGGGGLFYIRNGGTTSAGNETVGQLILGAGHNTILADGTGASRIGTITFSNAVPISRNSNLATLLVLGRALGDTTATQRGNITFSVDPGGSVGGTAGAGLTTNPIYPYVVGESTLVATTPDASVNFGNSFVRYVSAAAGFMPLTTAEYVTDKTAYDALGAGVLTNNVRFTATAAALASDTTGINSLVLDSATGITVTGPSQGLEITSGALLSAGAGANVIGGFSGITTGGARP
ncbi:MAG TPA: autotransporter-associated beta strand repeat-containing protein, partial [Prosthecobacter sp.]|nr:autotransporter-associated beta strand repeat-containing protein [Prosthecobacter sp.]